MNLSPNNETLSEKSFISNTFTEINIKKETDTSFRSLHPKLQNGPKSKLLKGNKTFEEELISRKLLQRKISLDNICLKNFSASFLFCFGGLAFLAKHFQKKLDATGLMNGSVRWRLQLFKNNKNILFYSWFLFSNHDCGQTVFFEIFYILFTTVTRQIKMDLKANWFSFFNSSGFSCCPLVRYLKSSGQKKAKNNRNLCCFGMETESQVFSNYF